MTEPKKLAVLVSGGGTDFQSILDGISGGEINGRVELVVSSNAEAYALTRAKNAGIPAYVCAKKDFASVAARDARILYLLNSFGVDFVLLAGYLGIVPPEIVEAYPYRIVNVHPALLPKFGGRDYYGLNVHRAVLAAHEPYSGATVHFVDRGTDTGPIIAQQSVPVLPGDTPETLQARILENVEHRLFPAVVRDLCDGKIFVENGKVVYDRD